jgi:hypothetical protein
VKLAIGTKKIIGSLKIGSKEPFYILVENIIDQS